MQRSRKIYKVRTTIRGQRVFITARGYRDAIRLQKAFGGKIV